MANSSPHGGHRQRLKQRFLDQGLDGFNDVQALELLLFYAIPQKDTNPVAHTLLDHFGSLSRVLEGTQQELESLPGVSSHTAALLRLIPQLSRKYQVDCAKREQCLTTLEQCGNYLAPFFLGRQQETVFLLCLDAKCKVLCCREVGEGSVNAAAISVRKIVETAIQANATTVVLAHNHPSGVAVPSTEDVQTTRRVAAALAAVEVHLADHMIVAEGDFVSMAQSGISFSGYPY